MLLPSGVEDYMNEDNPVRAIDAYVDTLDLDYLGFKHANGKLGYNTFAKPKRRVDKCNASTATR